MADATKTTVHPIGHMTNTQVPTMCKKNIFTHLLYSASKKILVPLHVFTFKNMVAIKCVFHLAGLVNHHAPRDTSLVCHL